LWVRRPATLALLSVTSFALLATTSRCCWANYTPGLIVLLRWPAWPCDVAGLWSAHTMIEPASWSQGRWPTYSTPLPWAARCCWANYTPGLLVLASLAVRRRWAVSGARDRASELESRPLAYLLHAPAAGCPLLLH
jgi:hypothetical protein